jgi:hypothetical protein
MVIEKIDEGSELDPFNILVHKVIAFSKEESPDIKNRLSIERELGKYFKLPQPTRDKTLNFILECLQQNK